MSKLNVCQELNCKKKESKDDYGTLCKFHAKKREKYDNPTSFFYQGKPLKYKTINKKNSVWENGVEHVRSIPTSMINQWLANDKAKRKTLDEMIKLIQEQIKENEKRFEDHQKTKNSRLVKH